MDYPSPCDPGGGAGWWAVPALAKGESNSCNYFSFHVTRGGPSAESTPVTDANRKRFEHYDTAITERFYEVYTQASFSAPTSDKTTMEMWKDLAKGDEEFQNDFARVFDNTDVKEYDNQFTLDSYDNYINMELSSDRGGEQTEYERFKKRLKNNQGRPIGIAPE